LTGGDLLWLRPAGGLAPGNEQALLGKRTTRSLAFGERITLSDVK
jgi:sialic acid synthase SpsE